MTSKKNWTLRAAVLMLALVLITSCFVGGTFAKYVTSGAGGDQARVAKFGVTVTAKDDSMFKTTYATDDQQAKAAKISASVESTTKDNLVAPGTKSDDAFIFSITGQPEVAVNVKIAVGTQMDVFLKKGTYPDLTTAATNDTFELKEDYYPVVYTLKQDGEEKKTGTLAEVAAYLNGISKDYKPNTDLSGEFGTFTLSWKWAFDGNDKADTLLGNLVAGTVSDIGDPMTHYSTHIAFHVEATVTQID